MSYDKIKINQENCNCKEYTNVKIKNQIVKHLLLSDEEIEQIIKERYFNKDEKTKTFIRKALRKHGDRYDYLKVNYVNNQTKVVIICHNHEISYEFPQTPSHHLLGNDCKLCAIKNRADKRRLTLEEFIECSRKIHGDKYDYSKVNYINNSTDVIITCPIHGDFSQAPNNHLSGKGCLKCSWEKLANDRKLTLEEFIERANKLHGAGTYDYSQVKYVNYQTEVIIICPKHGPFPQRPNDHLLDCGCPKCRNYIGEIKVRNFLIEHDVKFEEQKKFKDCKDSSYLPFDFYVSMYNLCIEYNGIQHFIPTSFKKSTKEETLKSFEYIQKHDQIKNNYCKDKGINLLRIRYDENVEEKLMSYFENLY